MPHSAADNPASSPLSLQEAFERCPQLRAVIGDPRTVEVRDGLSNHVLRVSSEKGVFFVRLGGGGTKAQVNRYHEAHNMQLAASLGLAVGPAFIDPPAGILATRAVEGLNLVDDRLPELLGAHLAALHSAKVRFDGVIDPTRVFEGFCDHLSLVDVAFESVPMDALAELFEAGQPDRSSRLVPSHGDVSPGNCLIAAGRLWLIDWEFSGMADPTWDLAYAIQENGFNAKQEERFLGSYERANETEVQIEALKSMKSRCDAISALWALSQLAGGGDQSVFLPFARERFTRALKSGD